jgi:hypothetical protein
VQKRLQRKYPRWLCGGRCRRKSDTSLVPAIASEIILSESAFPSYLGRTRASMSVLNMFRYIWLALHLDS